MNFVNKNNDLSEESTPKERVSSKKDFHHFKFKKNLKPFLNRKFKMQMHFSFCCFCTATIRQSQIKKNKNKKEKKMKNKKEET